MNDEQQSHLRLAGSQTALVSLNPSKAVALRVPATSKGKG